MALKLYEENDISAIADAIRAKVGGSGTYSVSASTGNTKMATAVSNIPSGGSTLGTKNITENGTYNASSDNLDGYSQVTVAVPEPSGTINISADGTYDVKNKATAVVSTGGGATLGTKTITEDGTYDASADGYDGYSQVTVSVGGGSSLPANIKTGTFTVAADAASQTVTHGGSTAPKYIFWMPVTPLSGVTTKYTVGGFYDTPSAAKCAIVNTVGAAVQTNVSYATVDNVTSTTFDIIQRDASYPIKADTYIFFAWFDA